ncbi:hypothetical protein [Methylobacterium sp. CCH5-D2]|uniref:hypothetical protein n=1 Tax=Methylobacterium sp. CCH5-D2 TaxID=1768765 RepID=UPI000830A2BB|nr:hypothetical protein [Methylobacterium sp. CCH5-D2]
MKKGRLTAFLVAELRPPGVACVYAVVAPSSARALELLRSSMPGAAEIMVVGGFSRDTVRRLHLKPGEVRRV